jgi:hypothetical protein
MKLTKSLSDERGVAMVVEIILVAVVLAAIGYAAYAYHMAQTKKTPAATKTTASTSVTVDASCIATYHDANLCHFASNSTSLNKMAYKATITEVTSGQSSSIVLENDGKGGTSLSGSSGGTQINTIELAGATYLETGGTWIKYPSGSSAAATNPTSSMNLGVGATGISYKEIDTEACGNLTCFKYQVTDSTSAGATQFAWFDNKSYLLREWKYTDGSGNSTDMNISYQNITITAPSPVESFSAAQ